MNYVKVMNGEATVIVGNPVFESNDSKTKAPFRTVIADGWPDDYAASFGVFNVDVTPPDGKVWDGTFTVADGVPTALFTEMAPVSIDVEREGMSCTPMQGQLVLGETNWGIILAWRDTQATWAQKIIIDSAQTWHRNSQNIQFFQYLLNFTPEQVDDLFRTATLIDA